MKRIILLFTLSTTMTVYGQDWGVGVRVGDPVGLTIVKYTDFNIFELNIGGADLFYDNKLYYRGLHNWYNEKSVGYDGFEYVVNKGTIPFGFQLNSVFLKDISYTTPALKWYYGFGSQFRIQKASYTFQYKSYTDPNLHSTTGAMVTDVDIGGNAIIGLDYSPLKIPISLFLDMSLFIEAVDDPFILWLQGGVGLRYNFGIGTGDRVPLRGPN